MTGYTRADSVNNIADGNIINASDLDGEFDAVQAAFNSSTGHVHDGTAANGAPITKIGPTQDVVASATALTPKTTATVDVGSSALKFKDFFFSGTGTLVGLTGTGAITLNTTTNNQSYTTTGAGTITISSGTTGTIDGMNIGATTAGTGRFSSITNTGLTSGRVVYSTTGGLETDSANLTFNGTTLTANTIGAFTLSGTIAGGGNQINNVIIGTSTPLAGAFTTLAASGAVTLSGGTANGVTYLNASKVLTSGTALTFDGTTLKNGLTSSGVTPSANARELFLDSSGNGGLTIGTGVSSLGSIFFADSGDNADGFVQYDQSGRTMRFGAAAAEKMRLDSSGNLGIGTSSPGARLDVSTASGNTAIIARSIAATNASVQLAGNGNTPGTTSFDLIQDNTFAYVYQRDNKPIVFGTNNTERMRIDSSGNVGIGTSSPGAKLDVNGAITMSASATTKLSWNNSGAYSNWIECGGVAGNNYMRFATGNTEAMRLDSSGNLGIGTSSPGSRLNVTGGSLATAGNGILAAGGLTAGRLVSDGVTTSINPIHTYLDDRAYEISAGSTSGFVAGVVVAARSFAGTGGEGVSFWTRNTERMRIDSSGNLGLGVTPSAWSSSYKALQFGTTGTLYSSGNAAIANNMYINSGAASTYITTAAASLYLQNSGVHSWSNAPSGTAGTAITFTQAMTLDASGNFILGNTTNSSYGTVRAYIESVGEAVAIKSTGGATTTPLGIWNTASSGTINLIKFFYSAGTIVGSITTNGALTTYNTTSDYRLKNNLAPLTGSGEFIDALQPKTWDWAQDGSKGVGFIAHEFAEVSPNSVSGEKDAVDAKGKPVYQSMQASSAEIIANLIAELQSLRKRLAAAGI